MFATLSRSWEFAKLSFGILLDFKQLIFFPIISTFAFLVITASFFAPLWAFGVLDAWFRSAEQGGAAGEVMMWLTLLIFYFVAYFIMAFFNTGLIACTMKVLDGQSPTIPYGITVATRRLPQIAGWALVAAVVGVLLRMLERNQKVGALITALIGTAWSALTFFVVPVLAIEGVGPITAIKRSGGILRQHWGTALVSNFSVGLIGFLVMLPVLLLGIALIAMAVTAGNTVGVVLSVALVVLTVFIVSSAVSAADVILKAVLYNYATDKSVPAGFDPTHLEDAFRPKD